MKISVIIFLAIVQCALAADNTGDSSRGHGHGNGYDRGHGHGHGHDHGHGHYEGHIHGHDEGHGHSRRSAMGPEAIPIKRRTIIRAADLEEGTEREERSRAYGSGLDKHYGSASYQEEQRNEGEERGSGHGHWRRSLSSQLLQRKSYSGPAYIWRRSVSDQQDEQMKSDSRGHGHGHGHGNGGHGHGHGHGHGRGDGHGHGQGHK